jgi:hypothetical protein
MKAITDTKNIPAEHWQNFCETFTAGNRGRVVSITIVSENVGELLAEGTILSAIDYDLVGKGDDLVISYGGLSPVAYHVVTTPLEIWQAQDQNGKVVALEIIDPEDRRTVVKFE